MEFVMCLSCGGFVVSVRENGSYVPVPDQCPECGGVEFKHNASDTIVRADE